MRQLVLFSDTHCSSFTGSPVTSSVLRHRLFVLASGSAHRPFPLTARAEVIVEVHRTNRHAPVFDLSNNPVLAVVRRTAANATVR